MDRKIILLAIVVGAWVAAPVAKGQTYSGTALYPLTVPSGLDPENPVIVQGDGSTVGTGYVGQETFAGQTVGETFVPGPVENTQALLWNTAGVVTTMAATPSESGVAATNGVQQVGGSSGHAILWSGTLASAVDLGVGAALGISPEGTQQVGIGGVGIDAMVWSGTAASAVDLRPTGLTGFSNQSMALGTDGSHQVGYGSAGGEGGSHAVLWSGTAASAVDLNPSQSPIRAQRSQAFAVSGGEEVGYCAGGPGNVKGISAFLWSGTAASAVNLAPIDLSGISNSVALGLNGTEQVGLGWGSGTGVGGPGETFEHALLWFGTGASAVDLETLLPSTDSWESSEALSVDSSGNVYGIATDNSGTDFSIEWSPVPEPASISLLGIFGVGMLMRRPRKGKCEREMLKGE